MRLHGFAEPFTQCLPYKEGTELSAKERLTGELSQPRLLGALSDYLLNTGVSVSKLHVCWPLICFVENKMVLYLSVKVGMLYM